MKLLKLYLGLVLLLNLSCASTQEVVFDYNLDIDFNQFNTFVLCVDDLFVEHGSQPNYDNKIVRGFIAEAVENEMKNRNHRTNVLNPELQVGFTITLNENKVSFTDCEEEGALGYWEECKIEEQTYIEETLIVYVSDFKTNEIIWQASIESSLNKPENKLKSHIQQLVKQLFDTYPKPKKQLF